MAHIAILTKVMFWNPSQDCGHVLFSEKTQKD